MAFRIEKAIGAVLVALVALEAATGPEQFTIPVRHRHVRKGAAGELRLGGSSLAFQESGKRQGHSRDWAYDEIQQLYVSRESVRILTYEDVAWKLGKDREYEFDELPEGAAQRILGSVRGQMDERRVVAAMPDLSIQPGWQVKAKLLAGRRGSEGIVLVGQDSIVYQSGEREASRTWHFRQIENISSSGPFDLTITTFEQAGARYAGRRDFRFQLKTELSQERYNALWARLNESKAFMKSYAKEK
ncbi:MAG TPA: hypothetical protein VMZ52_07850 [Bryobacteraceae bacterium]|nr:hypothetical protein [Bryobacteraceae bacterium]